MAILVYGATGFIGSLITRALVAAGHPVIVAGRDRRRLVDLAETLATAGSTVATRPVEVHDDRALAAALADADLLVACAAPHARVGEPLVRAALARGVPYLDTATGQPFLRNVYERYESRARKAGVTVVCGVGWQVAVADFAAHLAARHVTEMRSHPPGERPAAAELVDAAEGVDELIVAYAVSRFRPSAGARTQAVAAVTDPGYVWSGDRWDRVPPAAEHRQLSLSIAGPIPGEPGLHRTVSYPAGEIITIPRHVACRGVKAYLSVAGAGPLAGALARLAPVVAPALSLVLRSPLAAQARAYVDVGPRAPTPAERADSRFTIATSARRGARTERVVVRGTDPYGVAASLMAWAVAEILAGAANPGVRAPSEVFDPAAALAALGERTGLEIETSFGGGTASP